MIIGVDARELEGKVTGVGVYLHNILQRVSLPQDVELQLFFKKEIPRQLPREDSQPVLLRSNRGNFAWQQWILRRELVRRKVGMLFSPANTACWYYDGVNVITIHDLSFFRAPEWFRAKERISRQLNTAFSLKQADRIYVVSPLIREEIIARFDVPFSKILITPNGVRAKELSPEQRTMLRQKYELNDRNVVLYVGSIFNRRRLPVLLNAIALLDDSFLLVVIGENRTYPYQDLKALATERKIESRVRFLDYAPEDIVNDHYEMADLFVYLSDYEGFGIPPLEAMSYRVPVILSPTSALDMIFQESACFLSEIDSELLAQTIRGLFDNPEELRRLSEAGLQLSRRYTWDQTASIISQDWERLIAAIR